VKLFRFDLMLTIASLSFSLSFSC